MVADLTTKLENVNNFCNACPHPGLLLKLGNIIKLRSAKLCETSNKVTSHLTDSNREIQPHS